MNFGWSSEVSSVHAQRSLEFQLRYRRSRWTQCDRREEWNFIYRLRKISNTQFFEMKKRFITPLSASLILGVILHKNRQQNGSARSLSSCHCRY